MRDKPLTPAEPRRYKMGRVVPVVWPATGYDPVRLLDYLKEHFNLQSDGALAKFLRVDPPIISKIRKRRSNLSAALLIRIHDITTLSLAKLRDIMCDTRIPYPLSEASIPSSKADEG